MTHFLAICDPEEDVPPPARRLGEYFGRIVEAATASTVRGCEFATVVRCRRRPGRQPCPGRIEVLCTDVPSRIAWWCPDCGDEGMISSWRATPWDLSTPLGRKPGGESVLVHLPEEVHRALDAVAWEDPVLLRVVKGAEADFEDVLLEAPVTVMARLRDAVADEAPRSSSLRVKRLLDQAHVLLDISCF
jgi:hypothetical protein